LSVRVMKPCYRMFHRKMFWPWQELYVRMDLNEGKTAATRDSQCQVWVHTAKYIVAVFIEDNLMEVNLMSVTVLSRRIMVSGIRSRCREPEDFSAPYLLAKT
jgi:hypothetical protein